MDSDMTMDKTGTTEVTVKEHMRNVVHYQPNVDILEKQDELTVLADVPGVRGEDVDIHFENGTLTIRGKVEPRQGEETDYMLREYGVGDFYRTFQVSESIDGAGINAELSNGVLILHLPKVEAVKPRRIEVRAK